MSVQKDALIHTTFTPSQILYGTFFATGAGALCAAISGAISPLGGAIFGASCLLGNRLIHWICDRIHCCPENLIPKVVMITATVLGGTILATGMTSLAGFSITIATGICLTVGMVAVAIIALTILFSCLAISVWTTGMMLNSSEPTY